jgi:hypothetical protein
MRLFSMQRGSIPSLMRLISSECTERTVSIRKHMEVNYLVIVLETAKIVMGIILLPSIVRTITDSTPLRNPWRGNLRVRFRDGGSFTCPIREAQTLGLRTTKVRGEWLRRSLQIVRPNKSGTRKHLSSIYTNQLYIKSRYNDGGFTSKQLWPTKRDANLSWDPELGRCVS